MHTYTYRLVNVWLHTYIHGYKYAYIHAYNMCMEALIHTYIHIDLWMCLAFLGLHCTYTHGGICLIETDTFMLVCLHTVIHMHKHTQMLMPD